MLIRKASAPATTSWRITSGGVLAGPRVARIRTFRLRGTKRLAGVSLLGIDSGHKGSARQCNPGDEAIAEQRCRIGSEALEPAPQPNPREQEVAEGNVAADELRLLIERIERLEEEKKAIADDVKDVYGEAKARGYDPKTMRTIVRLRKMETNARQEAEAMIETYMQALGMK